MNRGSWPKPVVFSSANVVPGMASRISRATCSPVSTGIGRAAADGAGVDVVHDAAVGADRQPVVADVLPQGVHPAHRAAGHEDHRDAELLDRGQRLPGAGGDGAVGVQQGAVEVGGDQTDRGAGHAAQNQRESSTATPSFADGLGHVVGGLLDLQRRLAHGHAAAGPAQHLDVVAAVADREHVGRCDAELGGHLLQRGGLGDALGGDVEPGGPADEVVGAVQAELLGELEELLLRGVRVADDHAGDRLGDQLLDGLQHHLAGDLAVGERPVDPVADADLLDRDRGAAARARSSIATISLASKVTVERTSTRRVAEGHRAVAGHRQHVARRPRGSPSRSHTSVIPNVDRPVASTTCAPASYARRTASTTAGRMPPRPGRSTATLVNSVPSMSRATSSGVTRSPAHGGSSTLAALQVGLQRLRAPAPSRPPAGGSRGSRRWCAGSRPACR